MDLWVTSKLTIPSAELRVSASRASGPGGQHVNKTETKAEIRWNVSESAVLTESDRARLLSRLASRLTRAGDVVVTSAETRSRGRNTDIARERLAGLVRAALVVPKRRIRTRPSRGAVERRLEAKRRRSDKKRSRRWRHR